MVTRIFENVETLLAKYSRFLSSSATIWVIFVDIAVAPGEGRIAGAFPPELVAFSPGVLLEDNLPAVGGVDVYWVWWIMALDQARMRVILV